MQRSNGNGGSWYKYGFVIMAILTIVFGSMAGILAYNYQTPIATVANLGITHTPPTGPLLIGNAAEFDASLTGSNLQSVTMTYQIMTEAPNNQGLVIGEENTATMLLSNPAGNVYSYTLPGSQVLGTFIQYYISARDTSSNVARTQVYTVPIQDFNWLASTSTEIAILRSTTTQVRLNLTSINGFNKLVAIKVAGNLPPGVTVAQANSSVTAPGAAILQLSATSDASLVTKYNVEVDAIYSPIGSPGISITRAMTLVLTTTDFTLTVVPTLLQISSANIPVSGSSTVAYSMVLSVSNGFNAPGGFQTSIVGLPSGMTWQLVQTGYSITSGASTQTFNLVLTIPYATTVSLYLFNVRVSATTPYGTVSHEVDNLEINVMA